MDLDLNEKRLTAAEQKELWKKKKMTERLNHLLEQANGRKVYEVTINKSIIDSNKLVYQFINYQMIEEGRCKAHWLIKDYGKKVDILKRWLNQRRIATKVMTNCFNKKWNYIVFKLEKIFEQKNDKMLKMIIKLFKNIPVEVKDAICRKYIKACKFVHSIAIMEWRGISMKNSQ